MTPETVHCPWCGDDRPWPEWYTAGGKDGPSACPHCGEPAREWPVDEMNGVTRRDGTAIEAIRTWRQWIRKDHPELRIPPGSIIHLPGHLVDDDETAGSAVVGFVLCALCGAVLGALLMLLARW